LGEIGKKFGTNPLVSIITVNYNGQRYLAELFKSLQLITYQPVEIILVDNGSKDNSVEFTRRSYPEIKIIESTINLKYAKGNNTAIKSAKGSIICLINNDVVVESNFLEPLVYALQNDPLLGACQPKILEMENTNRFEYSGAAGGFIDKYGYPFMRGRIFYSLEEDRGQYNQNCNIFWASGACLVLRKQIFSEVGYLDEDFILHMEEIDLCWRLHLFGLKIMCIPESRIFHKGGGTLSTGDPNKLYWNFRNNIFLLIKNLSTPHLYRLIPVRILLDKIAMVYELLRGNMKGALAIIRAYCWLVRNTSLMWKARQKVRKNSKISDKNVYKLVYPGSIIWEYFLRNRKTFLDLKKSTQLLRNSISE
jgi:GT2 family glycosyltransferase